MLNQQSFTNKAYEFFRQEGHLPDTQLDQSVSQVNDGSRYHDQSPLQAAQVSRSAQKLSEKPAIVKKSNALSHLASQQRIGASSPLVADAASSYHNSHVLSGTDQAMRNDDMDIFHIDNARVPAEFDVNSKKGMENKKQVSRDKLIEMIQQYVQQDGGDQNDNNVD